MHQIQNVFLPQARTYTYTNLQIQNNLQIKKKKTAVKMKKSAHKYAKQAKHKILVHEKKIQNF